MSVNVVWQRVMPFALGLALLLSICTNLRLAAFPVGLGELLLALLSAVGAWYCKPLRFWKTPVVLFWICVGAGMVWGLFFHRREER
jgi:ABC-type multidrug transport system permease subunit